VAAEVPHGGRIKLSRRVLLLSFGGLVARLWTLQGTSSSRVAVEAADRQRLRVLSVSADRGVIYDQAGRILVRNVPAFNAAIVRTDLPDDDVPRRQVLERVATLLDMPMDSDDDDVESVNGLLSKAEVLPLLEPVVLKRGIGEETAFLIEQQQLTLPGVVVQVEGRREYLFGSLLGHLLGYVGPVPAEAVEEYRRRGYSPNDTVGQTGLEHSYESVLRGNKGEERIEVNAEGRKVRLVSRPKDPEPGLNLVLTLDTELQKVAAEALEKGMARKESPAGVVVALDPRDGAIRAMVSLPGYDNNLFSGGIKHEDLVRLSEDPRFPLVDRSVSGVYPPGSTFKMVTASAALQEGVIDRETQRSCGGIMYVSSDDGSQRYPFYCFNRAGHGSLNVVGAIRHSCDIFFYQVAGGFEDFRGLGQKRLASYAHSFSMGDLTGVDLPGELAGLIPDPTWKRLTRQELWLTGDTYNCAIGQGDILVTPLQLACATMAVANRGTVYQPRLGDRLLDGEGREVAQYRPRIVRQVPVSTEHLEIVREGMREVVSIGTARTLGVKGVDVAGKTGTAEFFGPLTPGGYLPMHAWFVCFAPYENPEIAVVVLIEDSGEGAYYAVPVAAEILNAYFGLGSAGAAEAGS